MARPSTATITNNGTRSPSAVVMGLLGMAERGQFQPEPQLYSSERETVCGDEGVHGWCGVVPREKLAASGDVGGRFRLGCTAVDELVRGRKDWTEELKIGVPPHAKKNHRG
jgi:hypothetical protein